MTTTTEHAAPTAADRAARASCFAAFAIQGFMFASLITRLPTIKDRFDLSDYQVLAVLGAVSVMCAVGSVAAGYLAVRLGSARVLRLALAAAAVCIAAVALPGTLAVLLVVLGVYGLFVGAIDATMNMQGVGIQDRYGRSIMVGFHGMWSLGAVIGGVYATITIELDLPLLATLLIVTAVALLVVALLTRSLLAHALPDDAEGGLDDVGGRASRDLLDHPTHHVPWVPVLLLAVPTFVMWFLDAATSAWGGIYLIDGLGSSDSAAPLAFTAYQLILLITRLLGDKVVRRYGALATVRGSGVICVVAVAMVVAAPSVGVAIAGFGLLGAGLAMIPPLSMVAAGHLDADGGGQALARVNVSNYVGYLVAALGIAIIAEQVSHRAMFVLPLVLAPVLVLMAGQFVPRTRSTTP
ncbi:MFS transporter [Nocardioides speluncae]|uniref:MFS transporter n=1 Tax=Nocardioides speluncae TaxID=2670337 RepID=UPI000D686F9D|nr:MFS transporter [Nocardioides speluncae]